MICANCSEELSDVNARWAFDEPYCEPCFERIFNYCSRCDGVVYRENAHYNSDGDPYCSDCFDEEIDEDAPDNPDVCDTDRKHIINLSRSWLQGNVDNRRYITINVRDYHLRTIREKIGLVEQPIYLFGLKDKEDYEISASQNLLDEVRKSLPEFSAIEGNGINRLGLSLALRQNFQPKIIDLIKELTKGK